MQWVRENLHAKILEGREQNQLKVSFFRRLSNMAIPQKMRELDERPLCLKIKLKNFFI